MADEPADNSSEFVELNVNSDPVDDGAATPAAGDNKPAEDQAASEEAKPAEEAAKEGDEAPLRDDKGRFKGGVQGRIDDLTRARREAERSAEYWKGIATRNGAQTGDTAAPTSKPTPDKYEDYGDYVEALTDWKVNDRAQKSAAERATEAEKSAGEHRAVEWSARLDATKSTITDFDAVMEKADAPTAPHVASAIMDAERGPELLYHLASHPEIVDRLNAMSPYRAAMELGRIETTLGKPAETPKPRETTTSKAPAPITPVQPGSTTAKNPSEMSMEEYTAFRRMNGLR